MNDCILLKIFLNLIVTTEFSKQIWYDVFLMLCNPSAQLFEHFQTIFKIHKGFRMFFSGNTIKNYYF